MKLFPQDNSIELYKTGFEDDILDRKTLSKQLSDLVERIEDPVVLSLDDKWGSGKTFFLKRWVAAHTIENECTATTVYFDAFENDYLTDPLVSLITAVSARTADSQGATVRNLKEVAAKLAKPALSVALSVATFGAKQHLNELGDAVAEVVSGEAKDTVEDLWGAEKDRKEAVSDFKNLLSDLAEKSPLVIVVDELDRCRPDYALNVLEIIKHFFSVPKVHFILGVNGKALENSVKARYGADIDAERYLRKFINVSFSLPREIGVRREVDVISKYASNLALEMELPDRVSARCISLLTYVSKTHDVSLRDVGKIFSKVALLPSEALNSELMQGYVDVISALLVTSVVDPQLHAEIISGNVATSVLREYLGATNEKILENKGSEYNSNHDRDLMIWFATLIFCCGIEELKEIDGFSSWSEAFGNRFSRDGVRNRKSIAPRVQKDFVEVFRT